MSLTSSSSSFGVGFQGHTNVLDKTECEAIHNDLNVVLKEDNICVAIKESNCNCIGTSGAILALPGDKFQQIGIVSNGLYCESYKPAVYTKVSYHLEWISCVTGLKFE